jgi:peptide/nickel transport system substrate-binding protein
MKKLFFILISAALIIAGCAQKTEPITGEPGGKLVIGTTEFPEELSPLSPSVFGSNDILDLLYMHLHRIDPETGKMKPELASSWEFSEDLSSITYYLRTDVKWWDGEPVTAEDVLYTYEKMADPDFGYSDIARIRFIKKAELVGNHAIRFTFDRVYADLLTDSDIMPVPKHVFEKLKANFGKKPVGNGPYQVKEFNAGSSLIMVANVGYYRGKPPLDEIDLINFANPDSMIAAFSQGSVDLILDITPTAAKSLSANKNVTVDSRPGNSYTYVGWNLNNEDLKDKDVRKAIGMAINRSKILNDIFAGMGTLSLGPLPPTSWGYSEDIAPVEYNPAKAKEILRQKGYDDKNKNGYLEKNNKEFTLNIITNIENPDRVAILGDIVNDLKSLGVKVNARDLDAAAFIRSLVSRNFDGFVMGWSVGDKIDPTAYWYSEPAKGKFNFISYKNRTTDSLIDEGLTMLNRKKAKETWGQFQKIVYEDQPYTFLIVPNQISATYLRVKGTGEGIRLASAYSFWIPEAERRVAVAYVPPKKPEVVTPVVPEKAPEKLPEIKPKTVLAPEKLLEAAAKKETTAVAVATPPPVAPPKASVITRPIPKKQTSPKYPESARALGATGRVVVRVVVGIDGKVKSAVVMASFGNPACEEAALAAAKKWEFEPATKDGVPFEQNTAIPFDFKP